jgi:hypothetical protein
VHSAVVRITVTAVYSHHHRLSISVEIVVLAAEQTLYLESKNSKTFAAEDLLHFQGLEVHYKDYNTHQALPVVVGNHNTIVDAAETQGILGIVVAARREA